jgi:sortase A
VSEFDAKPTPAGAPGPGPAGDVSAPRAASSFDRLESLDRPVGASANGGPTATSQATAAAVSAPRLTRRGRLRKWDRPKPPKDWRWWVGNLGKTLIATGLLMFGFVAYQLWGTGIETARSQNQLESEFNAQLADAAAVAPDVEPGDSSTSEPLVPATTEAVVAPVEEPVQTTEPVEEPAVQPTEPVETLPPVPVEEQNIPTLENGDAIARLEIPRMGRNDIVVAGVQTSDLKRGPGHFPDTPLPGQLGNAAIAGHRTTYGAPFFDVDDLEIGDDIIATTLNGTFIYKVTGSEIVESNRYDVIATTDPSLATLTLISCEPKYTAQKRIVIFSELVAPESAPVGEPIINYGRLDKPQPDTPAPVVDEPNTLEVGQVSDEIVDAFSDGWFSDPGANGQVGIWGALLALVGLGAYIVSRKLRRDWAGALIGIMPFAVVLYFFFQNVNRLLPPNL